MEIDLKILALILILVGARGLSLFDDSPDFLSSQRDLDTVDFVNSFLSGIDLSFTSPVQGECKSFSINGLDVSLGSVVQLQTSQKRTMVLKVEGLKFNCKVVILVPLDVNSKGSNVFLSVDFFSTDFDQDVPITASLTPGFNCPGDMLKLDLSGSGSGLITPFLSQICSAVIPTISSNLTSIISSLYIPRDVQSGSILEDVAAGEDLVEAILPEDFEFLNGELLQEVKDHMISEFTSSPMVTALTAEFQDLVIVVTNQDAKGIANVLQSMVRTLTEEDITIDVAKIQEFLGSEEYQTILNFLLLVSTDQDTAITLTLQFIQPYVISVEEFEAILIQLPEGVVEFLTSTGIADMIKEFLTVFESGGASESRLLESVALDKITVGDVLAIIPELSGFVQTFAALGINNDTTLGEAAFLILSQVSLQDITDNSAILDMFGASTTLLELVEMIEVKTEEFEEILNTQVDEVLLNLTSLYNTLVTKVPNLNELLAELGIQLPDLTELSLEQLLAQYPVTLPLGDGSFATIILKNITAAFKPGADFVDSGFAGASSVVLPQIFTEDMTITVGLHLVLVFQGTQFIDDDIFANLNLFTLTQEALTLAVNYAQMLDFGFQNFKSLQSGGSVLFDAGLCAGSSFGLSISSQLTHFNNFGGSVSAVGQTLEGFGADFITTLLDLYNAAAETVLEDITLSLTTTPMFIVPGSSMSDSCVKNSISLNSVGSEDDKIAGLAPAIFFALVGIVAAVALISLAIIFATHPLKKTARENLLEKQEEANLKAQRTDIPVAKEIKGLEA